MKSRHMKAVNGQGGVARIFCCLIVALMLLVSTTGALELANYSVSYSIAKPLSVKTPVALGVSSFGFCADVGGVAFGAEARPLDGSRITGIDYLPGAPDGRRLVLQVRREQDTYRIIVEEYDWVLIPTAKVAASDQDALVTYFGELVDEKEQERLEEQDADILNYHPALADTFLGLRVMQADLLAFHPIGPLHFTENGVPVKAPGETLGHEQLNRLAAQRIGSIYEAGGSQSYIICDVKDGVTFRITDNGSRFSLQGQPYWSCWRLKKDMDEILEDMAEDQALIMRVMAEMNRRTGENLARDLSSVEDLFNNPRYASILVQIMEEEQKKYIDSRYFERLQEASDQLSAVMAREQGGNPPVYQALTKTMQYAALFRHIKKTCPSEFEAFMRKVQPVNPEPRMRTPTVLIPRINGI